MFATALCFTSVVWGKPILAGYMTGNALTSNYFMTVTANRAVLPGSQNSVGDLLKCLNGRLFISQLCWAVAIVIVQCSLLAFYWRLFSKNRHLSCPRRSTQNMIWALAGLVTCWGLAVVCIHSPEIY